MNSIHDFLFGVCTTPVQFGICSGSPLAYGMLVAELGGILGFWLFYIWLVRGYLEAKNNTNTKNN